LPDQFEFRVRQQAADVRFIAGNQIIDTDDLPATFEQAIAQVGTQESRPSGDHASHRGFSFAKKIGKRPELA
jgi:hypothetical protein